MVQAPDYDRMKLIIERKGYRFFDTGAYNLNLIGIRITTDTVSDLFRDTLCCYFRDADGQKQVVYGAGTTVPGKYYFDHPMQSKGTAVLVPGQYRGCWYLGRHKGHPGFIQQKAMTVWRDANRNGVIDYDVQETGLFGINMHRSSAVGTAMRVGKWSAGCQVFSCYKDLDRIVAAAKESNKRRSNNFTYTLIMDTDLL